MAGSDHSQTRRQLHTVTNRPEIAVSDRSRSPRGDEVESMRKEEEAKIKGIKEAVEEEFAKTLPQDTLKAIKKFSLDLASKIEQLQKTNHRIKQHEEEINHLQDMRIPNGCKPVPYPYESPFLDSIQMETETVTVEFPEGTSLREAKRILHCKYLEHMRKIDLKIAQAQRTELRKSTRKQTFVERCLATYKGKTDLWKELDLDFDCDPEGSSITASVLEAKADNLYHKTVDQAAILLQKKREHEKSRQTTKEKLLKEMLEKSPEELLQMTIDARIAEKMPSAKKPAKPNNQNRKDQLLQNHFNTASAFVATSTSNDNSMSDPSNFQHLWKDLPTQPLRLTSQKGKGKQKWPSPSKGKGKNQKGSKGDHKGKTKGKGKGFGQPTRKGNQKGANTGSFLDKRLHHGKKGRGKGVQTGKGPHKKGKGKGGKERPW